VQFFLREEDVQYCVAERMKPRQRLIIARGREGGLGNAFVIKEMRPSKAIRQEKIARLSTGQVTSCRCFSVTDSELEVQYDRKI
jgi:hypothetical protein